MEGVAERPPDALALTRLRAAVTVFFALDGFVFAGWVVRIPAVKEQTNASASALGLALLGVSAGAVLTMMFTGRLCRRFGNHPMTVTCGALTSLAVSLPPLTHSAPALGGVLFVFGAAYGGLNVAMNSAAVDVVAALRRPVMPSFHAAFSLGGMLGSGVGGLVAGHLSPTRHLFALTLVGLLVTAAAGRTVLRRTVPVPTRDTQEGVAASSGPRSEVGALRRLGAGARLRIEAGAPEQEERGALVRDETAVPVVHDAAQVPVVFDEVRDPAQRRETGEAAGAGVGAASADAYRAGTGSAASDPEVSGPASARAAGVPSSRRLDGGVRGVVIVFGLIALCSSYGEGALADWGALHLQQDLLADAGVAATGYACFALAMTIGRVTGTALLERLGRTFTLVAGGSTAAVGMLLGSLAPTLWAALLGFGITGMGLANIFPVAIDRAGALAGASGVAAASTLGYAGMLLGPPAIGFMTDWFSLPTALISVAVLAAVAALVGYTTRQAGPA